MSISKIFCLGDGFAHGHIWPEWPQILAALLNNLDIRLISGIGAGNEFLIHGLLSCDVRDQVVIFQWAQPDRLDKIIEDSEWKNVAQSDPVYNFNLYQQNDKLWWLSSASGLDCVRQYHDFYIQKQQALTRLQDQKKLVRGYLESQNCRYLEYSTSQQDQYSKLGKFKGLRGHEVQPSPWVHLNWLIEFVLPGLSIEYDKNRLVRLITAVKNTTWIAYDSDRELIWQNLVKQLDIDL